MFIAILLLEFFRFPLGLFGSILVSFWRPKGYLKGIQRSLWGHFGGPWAPLGNILDDFGIIFGPSDYRKGSEDDEERFWDDFLLFFGYIM